MKKFTKITAIVLCLVMTFILMFSLSSAAFAEETVKEAGNSVLSFNFIKDLIQIIKAALAFIKADLPGITEIFLTK